MVSGIKNPCGCFVEVGCSCAEIETLKNRIIALEKDVVDASIAVCSDNECGACRYCVEAATERADKLEERLTGTAAAISHLRALLAKVVLFFDGKMHKAVEIETVADECRAALNPREWCQVTWRAGVLTPPGDTSPPDGARCVLRRHDRKTVPCLFSRK